LSVNNIRTPALIGGSPSTDLNASSSIKSDGFARFVSASIGGWGVDTGSIFSDNLEINSTGKIKTRDYIPDNKGWIIDETGIAEFANVKIRGTLATTTFEKESVNAVGGQLYVANSTTLSGSYSSSLDSTPATGVTSSTTLPTQFGDNPTDNLEFNSTEYSIASVDGNDKFTLNSTIYADNESATLNYSQSNAFSSQISASVYVSTNTSTPYSASVDNRAGITSGDNEFNIVNFSAITPSGIGLEDFLGETLTITETGANDVFTDGVISTHTTTCTVIAVGGPDTLRLATGYTFNSTYNPEALSFYISFTNSVVVNEEQSTQYVYKKAGTWPLAIENDGKITFNDGGGSHTFDILERVNAVTLRIDTSSNKPNTSGSFVVATGAYSSSHSDSITISAGIGSLTEFIYDNISSTSSQFIVDNVSGFAVNEILTLKKVTNTGFTTEYVQVVSSSRLNGGSDTDLSGILNVTRAYGSGTTGDSSSLGDIASVSQEYEQGQVVVSTGKVGSGFIRLNANPNDTSTPYMDIVERTGSGLYDVELKARLGDLSGLDGTDMVLGRNNPGFGLATDNVFLQGGIIATYGEIGGFSIDTNTISSSNNNLILRDNGQITGSTVLLDGGTIGGFEMGADIISSSNSQLILKSNGHITASAALISGSGIQVDTPNFSIDSDGDVSANKIILEDTARADSFTYTYTGIQNNVGNTNFASYIGTYSGSDGNLYSYIDLSGIESKLDNTKSGASFIRLSSAPTYPIGAIIHPFAYGDTAGYNTSNTGMQVTIECATGNIRFAFGIQPKSIGGNAEQYDYTGSLVFTDTKGTTTLERSYLNTVTGFYTREYNPSSVTIGAYTYTNKVWTVPTSTAISLSRGFFAWQVLYTSRNTNMTIGNLKPFTDNLYDIGDTNYRFDDIYATNATIQTSDESIKSNISDSDLGLSFVNALRPVSYRFNNVPAEVDDSGSILSYKTGSRTHYGLVAQEVSSSLGTLGKTTSDFAGITTGSLMGLRYGELISPMIKAIQELSDEVNQLKLQLSQSQG